MEFTLAAAMAACSATSCHAFFVSFLAKAIYDEQVFSLNTVDAEAAGNNISHAQFASEVHSAYYDSVGGVLDFDRNFIIDETEGADSFGAYYGLGLRELFIARRTDSFGGIGFNSSSVTSVISGYNYFGVTGSPSFTFEFSEPLSAWGFTALSRLATNGDRSGVLTITHDDGTTYSFPNELIAAGYGTDDTFFGYRAPAGKSIHAISWVSDNGYVRWDDFGFILARLAGDANADGVVDMADFAEIRDHLGLPDVGREHGDLNIDGLVDLDDFRIWRRNWNPDINETAASAAPEPSSWLLACVVAAATLARRWRIVHTHGTS